jgi:pilus assembly protein CpaF
MPADLVTSLRTRVQDRLLAEDPAVLHVSSRWERRVRVREAVARFLADERVAVGPGELAALVRDLSDSIVGLGPLEPLLRDPSVTEVMVNGPSSVYVEREGKIEATEILLADDRSVLHLIDRIVAPLGLRIDESVPWVDARLPDGSRVHAIVPPLAVAGPTLTIRRFSARPLSLDDLVSRKALSSAAAAFLIDSVLTRRSIIVSGGAGAGKTTLLGALAAHIPAGERVITIEDAAELRLQRAHVVSLETRPANVEGLGRVTVRDLVRNALRMRPDRILVGEVRGAEVLDMLQAMNTGHNGSMSTAHANSPQDLIARLEAMALMGESTMPLEAIRRQLRAALDVIVHVARAQDGSRLVTDVCTIRSADLEPVPFGGTR